MDAYVLKSVLLLSALALSLLYSDFRTHSALSVRACRIWVVAQEDDIVDLGLSGFGSKAEANAKAKEWLDTIQFDEHPRSPLLAF